MEGEIVSLEAVDSVETAEIEAGLSALSEVQRNFLLQRTPPREIFTRPGKGGKEFSYVEIGYVTWVLNQVFGFRWDFRVLERIAEETEVGVLGRLTVTTPIGDQIVKEQFGQSDIKRDRNNVPLSIIDDYKAAASDALKKCASLLGVASDVYGRDRSDQDMSDSPSAQAHSPAQEPVPMQAPTFDTSWGALDYYGRITLGKLGAATKLVDDLMGAIKENMTRHGTIGNADDCRNVLREMRKWTRSGEAVTLLTQLTEERTRAMEQLREAQAAKKATRAKPAQPTPADDKPAVSRVQLEGFPKDEPDPVIDDIEVAEDAIAAQDELNELFAQDYEEPPFGRQQGGQG